MCKEVGKLCVKLPLKSPLFPQTTYPYKNPKYQIQDSKLRPLSSSLNSAQHRMDLTEVKHHSWLVPKFRPASKLRFRTLRGQQIAQQAIARPEVSTANRDAARARAPCRRGRRRGTVEEPKNFWEKIKDFMAKAFEVIGDVVSTLLGWLGKIGQIAGSVAGVVGRFIPGAGQFLEALSALGAASNSSESRARTSPERHRAKADQLYGASLGVVRDSANFLNDGVKSIRAAWAEVLVQAEAMEEVLGIKCENVRAWAVVIGSEHEREKSFDNEGIAVGAKPQLVCFIRFASRTSQTWLWHPSDDVVLDSFVFFEWAKLFTKLDDVPVAFFPITQKFKVFYQFFGIHHRPHAEFLGCTRVRTMH